MQIRIRAARVRPAKAVPRPRDTYSTTLRDCQASPIVAERVECSLVASECNGDGFTAAFGRMMRQQTDEIQCPYESGAEATALQALRESEGCPALAERLECGAFTAAFLRAACHQTNENHRPCEKVLKLPHFERFANRGDHRLSRQRLGVRPALWRFLPLVKYLRSIQAPCPEITLNVLLIRFLPAQALQIGNLPGICRLDLVRSERFRHVFPIHCQTV